MNKQIIEIKDEFIKLDQLLKFSGLAESGGHAKNIILNGEVLVNQEICLIRGKKIRKKDLVTWKNHCIEVKN